MNFKSLLILIVVTSTLGFNAYADESAIINDALSEIIWVVSFVLLISSLLVSFILFKVLNIITRRKRRHFWFTFLAVLLVGSGVFITLETTSFLSVVTPSTWGHKSRMFIYQLMMTIGVLLAGLIGYYLTPKMEHK